MSTVAPVFFWPWLGTNLWRLSCSPAFCRASVLPAVGSRSTDHNVWLPQRGSHPPYSPSALFLRSFRPSVLLRSERREGGVGVGDKKWFGSIPSISAALGLARVRCAHKVKESTKLARPRTMRLSSDPTVPFVPYCVVLTPIEEWLIWLTVDRSTSVSIRLVSGHKMESTNRLRFDLK